MALVGSLMEMIACTCDGLPAHDHFTGHAVDERGVFGPVWDLNDVGRVWVDWKAVARELERGEGSHDHPPRRR